MAYALTVGRASTMRFRCWAPYTLGMSTSVNSEDSVRLSAVVLSGFAPSSSIVPTKELSVLDSFRLTTLDSGVRALERGVGGCVALHPRLVAQMAATSLSSWGFRLPRRPGVGCELRVIEQLLIGWRYTRAGIRWRERYSPAYRRTLSETFEGTTSRAGYVLEYC